MLKPGKPCSTQTCFAARLNRLLLRALAISMWSVAFAQYDLSRHNIAQAVVLSFISVVCLVWKQGRPCLMALWRILTAAFQSAMHPEHAPTICQGCIPCGLACMR